VVKTAPGGYYWVEKIKKDSTVAIKVNALVITINARIHSYLYIGTV
jgi:hypothetical protein